MTTDNNMYFWIWYLGRFEFRTDITEERVASIMTVEINVRIIICSIRIHTTSRPKPYYDLDIPQHESLITSSHKKNFNILESIPKNNSKFIWWKYLTFVVFM